MGIEKAVKLLKNHNNSSMESREELVDKLNSVFETVKKAALEQGRNFVHKF